MIPRGIRKQAARLDAQRPRREPMPVDIFGGLQSGPTFSVDHEMKPKWQTLLTFDLRGGPYADKTFAKEGVATWLSATLLTAEEDLPLEILGASVGYGAFVLSLKYLQRVRVGFSRRPYAGLKLMFILEGTKQELRCSVSTRRR